MMTGPLIRPDDDARIGDGTIYLDASILLPGQSGDPDADFREARLPNARRFDIDRLSDRETGLPHMAPTAGGFAKSMMLLGIRHDDPIVFYDRQGSVGASRAWWLARLFGHEKVFVLDGGLAAYAAAGGVVEQGVPVAHMPVDGYRTRSRYDLLAGAGDVLIALGDAGTLIVDARSSARFAAQALEPRPGVRAGHMPGAVNIPYGELLAEGGRYKEATALRGRFEKAGWQGQRVITTCGSGLTAATLTMGLVLAGLPPGRLYDGSWVEWGSDPALPIEEN
ncbi:thiosulfate sulfurtransferase [Neoasaia chiangmaiensis NBRC 101099]|nr:sulfurtransferase [Neoasaia chiangmaiensis]GBR38058.1 thiosulfate sulfurtransferase [Neoasaia chiangmaiensis NBRC 101099]GEN16716.1 sulfurtransferase [Neoasaia chiangmaiensis]